MAGLRAPGLPVGSACADGVGGQGAPRPGDRPRDRGRLGQESASGRAEIPVCPPLPLVDRQDGAPEDESVVQESRLDAAGVRALGYRHAEVETAGSMEETMATLVENPVYDFFPVGLRLVGRDAVRTYYDHLFEHFLPFVESTDLVGEWAGEDALTQEYVVHLRKDDVLERHFIIGILYVEGSLLGGERIWGSERTLRRLLGPLYDRLTPIP